MTTKNANGFKIALIFLIFIMCSLMGSFVVSLKYIDLFYLIACIVFGIKFIRMEG